MASKYQEQHYEDVARVISDAVRCQFGDINGATPREMANGFADLFAADNPPECLFGVTGGFDRERFLKACGLETEGSTCGRCGLPQSAGVHYPRSVDAPCPAEKA